MSQSIYESNVLTSIPSLGSLFGTSASPELINQINASLPTQGVFGTALDPFKVHYENFKQQIINPILATHEQIQSLKTMTTEVQEDKIVSIYNVDQLEFQCPKAMHMPILLHTPIRQLYEQGKISGWGYDISSLSNIDSKEIAPDIYGEMLKSCVADMDYEKDQGLVGYSYWDSTYPDLTLDELEDIQETREFLDDLLEYSDIDPTDPSNKIKK
jgi:hypothetical protein